MRLERSETRLGKQVFRTTVVRTPLAELDRQVDEYLVELRPRLEALARTDGHDLAVTCLPGVNHHDFVSVQCAADDERNVLEARGFTYVRGPQGFRPLRLRELFRVASPSSGSYVLVPPEAFERLADSYGGYCIQQHAAGPLYLCFNGEVASRPCIDLTAIRGALRCPLSVLAGYRSLSSLGTPLPELRCEPPSGDRKPLPILWQKHKDPSRHRGYEASGFRTGIPSIDVPIRSWLDTRLAAWIRLPIDIHEPCGRTGMSACLESFHCVPTYNDGYLLSGICSQYGFDGTWDYLDHWSFNFVRSGDGWTSLGPPAQVFLRADDFRQRSECFGDDYHLQPGVVVMHRQNLSCYLPVSAIAEELVCPLRFLAPAPQ